MSRGMRLQSVQSVVGITVMFPLVYLEDFFEGHSKGTLWSFCFPFIVMTENRHLMDIRGSR
jgi:hypothetical protein